MKRSLDIGHQDVDKREDGAEGALNDGEAGQADVDPDGHGASAGNEVSRPNKGKA